MKKESSTNSANDTILQNYCNAHKILSKISGRWKVSILFALNENILNYSDFKAVLPSSITDRILAKQLKELQEDEFIENNKDKTKSEYFLTETGKKVLNLLQHINTLDFN
ncbi:winged helix-turn-helix transcriptional regulator [Chryseobacterium balustinum]|uniref:winged helix-turn-helix transcriptional regulator n=1 Tax=Chryseobacterium balustinum TaxID=246 RepID=UPI003CEFF43C